jgi:excisionase family DNA binding protein
MTGVVCEPVLLTVPDVMAQMKISRHQVYQLINQKKLDSLRIGRSRRIPATAVIRCVKEILERGGC